MSTEHGLGRVEDLAEGEDLVATPEAESIDDRRRRAAQLMVQGFPVGTIAKKVNVRRETVWRWANRDPVFRAYLTRLRVQFDQAFVDRMWSVAGKALDTAEKAIEEGDAIVALQYLRLPGLNAPVGRPKETPELVEPPGLDEGAAE
jgi:hypothetical protein